MAKKIIYRKGDATHPVCDGNCVIAHVCNDAGRWGKGFVLAISKRWKMPSLAYRKINRNLGTVQFIRVEDSTWVANMIAQHGVGKSKKPIRYDSLKTCLHLVSGFAKENNCEVHMPRIGCGLAGGKWGEIEPLINETLVENDIQVVVYDLE